MFTQEHFDLLTNWGGKDYLKDDPSHKDVYGRMKFAYEIIEQWAENLQEERFPDGYSDQRKSPVNQGQKFEKYWWAKIYPNTKSKEKTKEILAYTVHIEESGFVVKLDTIGLNANDPKRKKYEELLVSHNILKKLSKADGLNMNLNQLVEWSVNSISDFNMTYDEVNNELQKATKSSKIAGKNAASSVLGVPIADNKTAVVNEPQLNQILYGPPGTGKTYNTINKAVAIANPNFSSKTRNEIKAEFDRLLNTGQIVFTTFHQSMNYEDFIEGIKPETTQDGNVVYEIKDGIFKKICESASTPNQLDFNKAYERLQKDLGDNEVVAIKTPTGKEFSISLNSNGNLSLYTGLEKTKQGTLTKENMQKHINGEINTFWGSYFKGVINYLETKYQYSTTAQNNKENFVLIIDEINRGNVSQIFGELITLIEDDKRLGKEESLKVVLPYSKVKFGVPSNLYIIGTMNTADRSVEALDAALRRRFSFEEMPPKPELISSEGKLKDKTGILECRGADGALTNMNLASMLETINKRIKKLLDNDHQIGHSYFMQVASIIDLQAAFQNKIIPLLKEYFFGDYGKIGLVLGQGFIEAEENSADIFAEFQNDSIDSSELAEHVVYKIKNISDLSADQFVRALRDGNFIGG